MLAKVAETAALRTLLCGFGTEQQYLSVFGATMNLVDFKQLPMGQQAKLLRQHGHFLAERAEDSCRLRLYALGDFYAEEWRLYDEERILFIHLFQHPTGLTAYLEKIRLPEV
jgi:hypothetical protein